jgi:hypothetical protein
MILASLYIQAWSWNVLLQTVRRIDCFATMWKLLDLGYDPSSRKVEVFWSHNGTSSI